MKRPIALLANDLHISTDTISEFEKNWQELLSICCQRHIDDVVIGGDMFTSRSSQSLATLRAVDKALEDNCGLLITIAEGNHDKVDLEDTFGYNHIFRHIPNVNVVDNYEILEWEDCDFILLVMSYFPENGSFINNLNAAVQIAKLRCGDIVKSERDIILYVHEGIHGALGDFEIDGELPQEPLLRFKAVLSGHYHNRIKIKGTNIEYIGSSRQHNFGEDEEKGYTILFDDGSYEFVKNQVNTRYKTIELTPSEADSYQLDKNPLYKYKVKVKCTEKEAKNFDKQKYLAIGFNKVEAITDKIVAKEAVAAEIHEKYDIKGIKREYKNYCNENSIDCSMGIKYLEG